MQSPAGVDSTAEPVVAVGAARQLERLAGRQRLAGGRGEGHARQGAAGDGLDLDATSRGRSTAVTLLGPACS